MRCFELLLQLGQGLIDGKFGRILGQLRCLISCGVGETLEQVVALLQLCDGLWCCHLRRALLGCQQQTATGTQTAVCLG